MGDDCCNPESMGRVVDHLQHLLPATFIHSVRVGDSADEDRNAGFFGVIREQASNQSLVSEVDAKKRRNLFQVDVVCNQLAVIPELANGFNAIGFSQGGLFLRAYVEQCNQPPVRRLITFGSPHAGVSDVPNCVNQYDLKCLLMRSIVRRGVYTSYVQHRVVQAQYFKDFKRYEDYLGSNIFLPDLNNELSQKNQTYANRLAQLDVFVMIRFAEDTMLKPAETSWFWTLDEEDNLIPLEEQDLYHQDWLGLKRLHQEGRLKFLVSPGRHMQISDDYLEKEVVWPYLADNHHRFLDQSRDTLLPVRS
ncbi:hypothetical protein EC973_004429 [Apophysomyces ossiformis]|uniref:Palmitoyl-protein hydrolase n=1 Tax=Apophysomyces ossiformis TaxID=679940 RepID=A0A8H7BSZ7_9FUNG|nr:hypothetical protein EC973_004429 [Apophysomyces ossiformis]